MGPARSRCELNSLETVQQLCSPQNLASETMADSRSVMVVSLSGSNYPTWKVQCRMALIKDGLWNIVNGTENPPDVSEAGYEKFVGRRDRALAIIVLSVEPSLLYIIGDPEDPVTVWKKLADQFQKKTWANKLELRHKLCDRKRVDLSSNTSKR